MKHSLAIGSSGCIHCPNDDNLAFLILQELFVAAMNLTVIQGMIIIFYANLIWAYQNILCPSDFGRELIVQKPLLVVDFGTRDLFFSWYECLHKSMATVHIPLLHCWSFPSRPMLFLKIVYTIWQLICSNSISLRNCFCHIQSFCTLS